MNELAAPSTAEGSRQRWRDRDTGAQVLRLAVALLPTIVATFVVFGLMRLIPETGSVTVRVSWILWVAIGGFATASVANRFVTKLLPLAALMRLSLVFPDQAPSRLRLAIRAASTKKLKAEVESARHHGLSSDSTKAAGQLLLLTTALGEHDRRTRGHSERVRLYSRLLGEEMGIAGEDLDRLQWGALLHDVGKLTIPSEILNKPGTLEPIEWTIMSGHAEAGSELVAPLHPFLGPFVSAADGHHERWDGTGYPHGLFGERIPLAARIVAVADAYEVMTASRPYKKPMSPEAARAELASSAGTHFDPAVVRAWMRLSIGELNKAAAPIAALAGIPLLGEIAGLFTRTLARVSDAPAVLASAAPAAATAGAMTVAMAAAPPPPVAPSAAIALDLTSTTEYVPEPVESSPTTMQQRPVTAYVTQETTTTSTTTAEAPTTVAPTIAAPTTSTTVADTTPTTTTTTTPPLDTMSILVDNSGAAITLQGAIPAGTDVTPAGPFAGDTHLFRDPAQVLTNDVWVGDTMVPSGSTVCVHLFVTTEAAETTWRLDYGTQVLAVASRPNELVATDNLQEPNIFFGPPGQRGLHDGEDKDENTAVIRRDGTRVRLTIEGGPYDHVRILLDCGS